jgi:hypothetical protein
MASIAGSGAWRGLNVACQRKDIPDAPTIEDRIGSAWDEANERIRSAMEQNGGKAVAGSITFTLKLKGHKTPNGEYAVDVDPGISSKLPNIPMTKIQVYLDHDSVAHTAPVQVDMPIMGIRPSAIEGGKNNVQQPGETGKKKSAL